jgi:glycosyltransferase involved in cell wall biosynthesis
MPEKEIETAHQSDLPRKSEAGQAAFFDGHRGDIWAMDSAVPVLPWEAKTTSGRKRMGPETSVIIPVRNGAKFVVQAIISVLEQLGEDDELIVVDDGSTDETPAIVADIADHRLRRLANGGRGVSAARNLGLAATRGEFVAFLDHDDLWPAGRHRGLMMALQQDATLDAVFGRLRLRFDPNASTKPEDARMDGCHICSMVATALYRCRLFAQVGGFDEDLKSNEDNDLHLRLTEAGMRSQLCDVDALIYRRHDANMTNDLALMRQGRFVMVRRKLARARARALTGPDTSHGQ